MKSWTVYATVKPVTELRRAVETNDVPVVGPIKGHDDWGQSPVFLSFLFFFDFLGPLN